MDLPPPNTPLHRAADAFSDIVGRIPGAVSADPAMAVLGME